MTPFEKKQKNLIDSRKSNKKTEKGLDPSVPFLTIERYQFF